MIFSLVYVSHAVAPFDDSALETLAARASQKNSRLEITGYLNLNRTRSTFFQYLEGPQQAVLDLTAEIERDDRHRVANIVQIGEIESRLFPAWNMCYLDPGFFQAIRMEDVLETVLLTMSERTFKREEVVSTVLRIARQIANRKAS